MSFGNWLCFKRFSMGSAQIQPLLKSCWLKGCERSNKDPTQNTFMQDAEHESHILRIKKKIITITLVHLKSTLFLVQFNKSRQGGRFAALRPNQGIINRLISTHVSRDHFWNVYASIHLGSLLHAVFPSAPEMLYWCLHRCAPTSSPHMQHVPYSRRWWALSLTWLMFVAPQPPLCRAELVVFQMWAVMRFGPTRCLQCVGPCELLVALLLSARAFFSITDLWGPLAALSSQLLRDVCPSKLFAM